MRGVSKSYDSGVRGCSATVSVLRDVDLTVYAGDGTSDDPEVSAPPDHCMAAGDTSGGFPEGETGGSSDTSSESTTTAAQDDDAGGGCGCTSSRGSFWALVLLPVLRRRRARRPR